MFTGPNTIKDGLVFCYDMGNTEKSWKGRPFTNQFHCPTPDGDGNVTFEINGNGTFKRIFSGTYGEYVIKSTDIVYKYVLGETGCHYHGNDVTINQGQTATFTCDYYLDPSCGPDWVSTNFLANMEGVVGGSVGVPAPYTLGVWKTFTWSYTAGSTGTCRMLLYPGGCGGYLSAAGFILYKNPQVEFDAPGNVPSPFVVGTRTETQAILDLTENNTITVSALTYNSDNTFSFNGSISRIDTGSYFPTVITGNNNFTIECWVYPEASQPTLADIWGNHTEPYKGLTMQQNGATTNQFSWGYGAGTYWSNNSGLFNLTASKWNHVIATRNGSNLSAYVNAVLITYGEDSGALSPNSNFNFQFGTGYNLGSGRNFNGKIALGKIYDRALTAAEILQNYVALKTRFGL